MHTDNESNSAKSAMLKPVGGAAGALRKSKEQLQI